MNSDKMLYRKQENKHALYCREDYMKKKTTFLREHAATVINFLKA